MSGNRRPLRPRGRFKPRFQGLHPARTADDGQPQGQRDDRQVEYRRGLSCEEGRCAGGVGDVDYKSDFFRSQWAVETARQQLTEAETSQPKEIGQAEAEMEKTKLELAQLQADFERARDLYYKQAASKTECEEAETRFRAAEQHIRSMDYAVGAMRLRLAKRSPPSARSWNRPRPTWPRSAGGWNAAPSVRPAAARS